MNTSHTQTNWETDGLTIKAPPGFFCETRMTLATMGHHVPAPEREANARLMSSAPMLLEALKEIVAAADGKGWAQLDPSLSRARAAIAAATN